MIFVALGLLLSALAVRETTHYVTAESKLHDELSPEDNPTPREVFWRTTLLDRNLSSVSQHLPTLLHCARMSLGQIGTLAAIYPAAWGIAQLLTGALSDRVGRKWLIASGMWFRRLGLR